MSDFDKANTVARRELLKVAAVGVATLVLPVSKLLAADAKGLPPNSTALSETDSFAVPMGYREDASKVDKAKFSNFKAGQNCSNCNFYKSLNAKWGSCQLFTTGLVASKGWCSSWMKKA